VIKAFLSALIIISSIAAYAQEEKGKTLQEVVVEGTPEEPPLDYPSAFSTVIDLKEFQGEYNTAAEILSFSPGVVVRDYGGFGQLKTISIRGSSNDQVVILLDGVRLNNPLGGGVDLSTIPLNYVERFEIVRGGASAFAGTDAIGGLVNIVTKKTDKPFTFGSATYGSYQTFGLNFSRAQKVGDFSYLISFAHAQSEGDFKFKSVNDLTLTRINNQFHSESLLGKVSYDPGNGWQVNFMNEFFYDDRGVPGLGEFQQPDANQKDMRNLTSINISKQQFISSDTDLNMLIFNRFDYLKYTNPEPTVGIPIDSLSKTYSLGVNPQVTWYAPYNQVVKFATEMMEEKLYNEDYDNPERFTFSLFASDEITLLDDLIEINPVIRYDLWTTSGLNTTTDSGVSPKLGVIVTPLKVLSFKANIGRSYRAPSFGELFFPNEGFIRGNPDLKPETSYDFDIGFILSHRLGSLEFTYFRNHINDLILFVYISSQTIQPENVGNVNEQGIETSLVLKPSRYFELFAGYTFLDGEINQTGAQLPGRPRNKFDLRAVLNLNYVSLFWETHYVDKIPVSSFPDSKTTPARTTYNAGAKAEWKKLFLTLEIKNLFNNLNVRDALDFPLPGRTYFATAGMNF
jgi:vitamin B12 transporter